MTREHGSRHDGRAARAPVVRRRASRSGALLTSVRFAVFFIAHPRDVRAAGRADPAGTRRRCAATTPRSTHGSSTSAARSGRSRTRCTGSGCSRCSTRSGFSSRSGFLVVNVTRLHVQPLVADVPQRLPSARARPRELLRARAQPHGARAGGRGRSSAASAGMRFRVESASSAMARRTSSPIASRGRSWRRSSATWR